MTTVVYFWVNTSRLTVSELKYKVCSDKLSDLHMFEDKNKCVPPYST